MGSLLLDVVLGPFPCRYGNPWTKVRTGLVLAKTGGRVLVAYGTSKHLWEPGDEMLVVKNDVDLRLAKLDKPTRFRVGLVFSFEESAGLLRPLGKVDIAKHPMAARWLVKHREAVFASAIVVGNMRGWTCK